MKDDKVWTVNDYFDGCILGVADFNYMHCIYERIFEGEKDAWTNNYYLTPISSEDFEIIINSWEIWKKWRMNFDRGIKQASYESKIDLEKISMQSNEYRKLTLHGEFSGDWRYCENMFVRWTDPAKKANKEGK